MRFLARFAVVAFFSPALFVFLLGWGAMVISDVLTMPTPTWWIMVQADFGFAFALYSFFIMTSVLIRESNRQPSPTMSSGTSTGGVGDECPDVNSTSRVVETGATGGVTTPKAHSCRAFGYESRAEAHHE